MTRLADRIIGRIADKVSFQLLYRDWVSFGFYHDTDRWIVISSTFDTRVEMEVEAIYVDKVAGRYVYGPGFKANLAHGVTLVGWWDGDTEEEQEEAGVIGSDDDDDEEEDE
nr:MAG TPA: hypothetical protein [Caudoviricetes sp.]